MEKNENLRYQANVSWLFIPFSLNRGTYADAIKAFDASFWKPQAESNQYLLKFISDKYDSTNRGECCCFRYCLNDNEKTKLGFTDENVWKGAKDWYFRGEMKEFHFFIQNVHLFCFGSLMCIMAFQIHAEETDPLYISTLFFNLKKASSTYITPADGTNSDPTTLLELSKALVDGTMPKAAPAFFEFSNCGEERSNVMCFLELPDQEDYTQELFYLRHCYSDSYKKPHDITADKKEILSIADGFTWGISQEALVCIASDADDQKRFRENAFFNNFKRDYLLLYVLLLHQKYMLYRFLTRIGIGKGNDLELLESYQQELYEFETDYVFSTVSEVPQYQLIYERVEETFALRKMFDDVHYPLKSLSSVRQKEAEKANKKREKYTGAALSMLSVLGLISSFKSVHELSLQVFGITVTPLLLQIICGVAWASLCVVIVVLISVFIAEPTVRHISIWIKRKKHEKK